jgi:malonyl-CoA O-methyltransferase
MSPHPAFRLDRSGVRRAFDRASAAYDAGAVLQTRVRDELLERLALVRLEPTVVLDLGAGTGHGAQALKRRYRRAQVIALDSAPGMLRAAARQSRWRARFARVCGDASQLPLKDASVDLVFSNLMLQWCDPLEGALAEVRRVLRPGGFFAFSSFGPDTLAELRAAWSEVDAGAHVSAFLDMHDVGDAAARAGLTEPVLDVERIALTYADVRSLVRDLKSIGAQNATAARARGLTGKSKWRAMEAAYEHFRSAGRLPATYEVIYGAAWSAPRQERSGTPGGLASAHPAEQYVPLTAIRRRPQG